MSKHHSSIFALLAMVTLAAGSVDSGNGVTTNPSVSSTSDSFTSIKEWHESGTLHNKSAFEWQAASSEDKLATCAEIFKKTWQDGNLKPEIASNLKTVEDIRPYAQELIDTLDVAFKPDPDLDQKGSEFSKQTVADTAEIWMVTKGWLTESFGDTRPPQDKINKRSDQDGQPGGERFLRKHLSELLRIKDKETFKVYGFGKGGPHNQWIEEVQAEHQKKRFPSPIRIAIGDLLNLGLHYASNKGREDDYTRFARQQIEDAIRRNAEVKEAAMSSTSKQPTKRPPENSAMESAKWRTWTTHDRKYSVEAKFVKLGSGILTLEKKDGSTVDVKLDLLCPEDQEFVKERKWIQ